MGAQDQSSNQNKYNLYGPTGLQYGAPEIYFTTTGDFVCQNCTFTQGGETKEYNDEDGATFALLVKNKHLEFSIDGIVSGQFADKEQGTQFTLTYKDGTGATKTCKPRVQTWQRTCSNEDCAKISMTARTYPTMDTDAGPTGS